MRKQMKILWLSNNPHMPTGYGRQTKHITQYLAGDHPYVKNPDPQNVYILGLQQIGASVKWGKIKILPISNDLWAKDAAPFWLNFTDADLFITLMDVWVFQELYNIGQQWTWCPYVPLDSKPLSHRISDPMRSATVILPFSEFGVQQLKDEGFANIFHIPHGYDGTAHKRLTEEEKTETRKSMGIGEDKFVVMSVGMNIGFRKGFPRLMRAFKKLNDEHKDTVLWLHTDPEQRRGIPLRTIAKRIGLVENKNLIFTPGYGHGHPYPENKLNELMNMCDIHALATMGEGFGLPIIESMAVGKPNVLTDFSTTREFVGNNERGLAVKVAAWWTTPLACQQALIDVDDLHLKLKTYYEDRQLLEKHSRKAEEFVKRYEWANVLPKWNELVNKIREMKS